MTEIFFSGEGNSGLFQVVAKSIFPGEGHGANRDEISFYNFKAKTKIFFY